MGNHWYNSAYRNTFEITLNEIQNLSCNRETGKETAHDSIYAYNFFMDNMMLNGAMRDSAVQAAEGKNNVKPHVSTCTRVKALQLRIFTAYMIWQESTFVSNMLRKTAHMLCIVGSVEVISNFCTSVCCKSQSLTMSVRQLNKSRYALDPAKEHGYYAPKVTVISIHIMHRKRRVLESAQ